MLGADAARDVTYHKRLRMERDLVGPLEPPPDLPAGVTLRPWDESLLEAHADVKRRCFADEIDSVVFPNLRSSEGCLRLMRDIRRRPGFRPEATWLLVADDEPIGTVQGVAERYGVGTIQNLGVVPGRRGRGLGTALLLQAMHGFRATGMAAVRLDVTAQNADAARLYRRLGFRFRKTLYAVTGPLAFADDDWSV